MGGHLLPLANVEVGGGIMTELGDIHSFSLPLANVGEQVGGL